MRGRERGREEMRGDEEGRREERGWKGQQDIGGEAG